jgi:UDP-glucose 4-epimerase
MKILITGGSGFLGQRLIDLLSSDNHKIHLLGRHKSVGVTSEFIKADITDIDELRQAGKEIGPIDCLIHLAALVPKTAEEDVPESMFRVNLDGTINLLDVFGKSLKSFVYASTAEVYGLPDTKTKISENLTPRPLSYYGASKLAGELFCQVYGKKNNLPVTVLRFGVMYGPGDTISRAVPNFINNALRGKSLEVYGGEELRDYLNVSDAALALMLAANKAADGVFNISTGEGISIKETAQMIIEKINPKIKINLLPRQKKASDIVLDIRRAREELGFKPWYKFPDKLEEQIEWHKKN